MEVAGTGKNRGICSNCKGKLSEEDKRVGMPICVNCIKEIIEIARKNIGKHGPEKFSNDVDNFTNFISSSSMLMKLDNIVVIQACFNIFMTVLRDIQKIDLSVKEQILRDSKRFIELELKNTELGKERKKIIDEIKEDIEISGKDIFDMLIGGMDRIIERYDVKKDISHDDNGEDNVGNGEGDINSNIEGDIDRKDEDVLKGSKRIKIN